MLQCVGHDWHLASPRARALNGPYRRKADNGRNERSIRRPRLTHSGHWGRCFDLANSEVLRKDGCIQGLAALRLLLSARSRGTR